jgi:predicted kinase
VTDAAKCVVVTLVGLPGAGKSLVAGHLARELGLRRVCRDDVGAAMFPRCRWTPTERRAAFRAVLLAVEVNLVLGESTVIDGMTFSRERDRQKVAELALRHGAHHLALWLDVPAVLARARVAADLEHGASSLAGRTPQTVDTVQERFEAPSAAAWIDASLAPDEVCAQAAAVVGEWL